ncbi:MAG: FAD:protein FMN transferase [Planctomycetota bacterium]|nr:FAD:protein FMN transferase [Planctomycetota bacterium]
MFRKSFVLSCLAVFLCQGAALAQTPRPEKAPKQGPLIKRSASTSVMGTSLEIAVLGREGQKLDGAIRAAIKEMKRVEAVFTTWKKESIISKVNRDAGGEPVVVPKEVITLTKRAAWISKQSEGAFDLTWGSVGKLWDFKAKKDALVPSKGRIKKALAGIGFDKIKIDEKNSTLWLPKGTTIGYGGIAKGYGVDRAIELLKKRGIKNAIVNAGGDLRTIGTEFGKPFNITIKHPRDKNKYLAILPVANAAIVSSGDYERYITIGGKRYSHILDPRSGWPVEHTQSVTLIAPDAALADALATGVFVMGPKKGLELVNRLKGVEALIVDAKGVLHLSKGLKSPKKKVLHVPEKKH